MLRHFRQMTNCSCGAAAFRTLISDIELISEKQAVDEVETKKSGTFTNNIRLALNRRGIENNLVHLDVDWDEYLKWLKLNSVGRKLYLACIYYDKPYGNGRGRPRIRHHAIVVSNGEIFDPAENEKLPIEAYNHIFSRKLVIEQMILVDL